MFSAGLSKAPLLKSGKGNMARARNIKPGVFKNEILVELPAFTRLLFIGLWTMADREGRVEDRPKRLKLELFPYDSDDINEALDSLREGGFIHRYESSGVKVISINNFLKHQNPHGTEKDSELPDEGGNLTVHERDKKGYVTGTKRVNNVKSPVNNVSATEVNVDPVCNNALNPDSLNPDSLNPELNAVPTSPKARRKQQLPVDFFPNELGQSAATAKGLSVANEFQKFHDYHISKGNVMADWQAAWRTWVGNARTPIKQVESFRERDARIGRDRWEQMTGEQHPDNVPRPSNVLDVIEAISLKRIGAAA